MVTVILCAPVSQSVFMNLNNPLRSSLSEIDWSNWKPGMRATLIFIMREDEVLLIEKKTGLGAGKINGPGGKIELGETPREAIIRETQEEVGLTPHNPREVGELFFIMSDGPDIHCVVYTATEFEGEMGESIEALPFWEKVAKVPYDKMWEDDQYWLPQVLEGHSFVGQFAFDGEKMLDRKVVFDQIQG